MMEDSLFVCDIRWEPYFLLYGKLILYEAKLHSGCCFLIWKSSELLNNLYG